MAWPLASELFVRGDKWLCTREGAAGIQGCTGCSPGASRGCWLGTAWSRGAEAASGRRAEPRAPTTPCSVGYRQVKAAGNAVCLVFWERAACQQACAKANSCRTAGMAGDGVWVQPLPRVLLPFSLTAELWLGFPEAELQRHRKTCSGLRAGRWLTTDPSALQGLIKQRCIRPGKRRCSRKRDAVGRRLKPEL